MIKGCPTPEQEEFRCQAKSRHTGMRCRNWALKKQKFCKYHTGGGTRRRIGRGLSSVYKKQIGPLLREKIEELAGMTHAEQVNLYDELALTRAAAQQAVRIAGAALESTDDKIVAGGVSLMNQALSNVKDFVMAAAKVEALAVDKVSFASLNLFVLQIVRAIHKVCGDNVELAHKIELEIHENVELPKSVEEQDLPEGTHARPSDLIKLMDEQTGFGDKCLPPEPESRNTGGIDQGSSAG